MSNGRIFYHLFSEQAIYTRNLIESILENLNNVVYQENRLRQNQKDICKLSVEYIGYYKAKQLFTFLDNRVDLIIKLVKSAKSGIPSELDSSIRDIFSFSDIIAKFLSEISNIIQYDNTNQNLNSLNQYIIDMTLSHLGEKYLNEIKIFDEFHQEMLSLSDMFSNSFPKVNHNTGDSDWSMLLFIILFVFIILIILYLIHKYSTYKVGYNIDISVIHPASLSIN